MGFDATFSAFVHIKRRRRDAMPTKKEFKEVIIQ